MERRHELGNFVGAHPDAPPALPGRVPVLFFAPTALLA